MSSVEVFEVFPDDKEANLFVAKCDVNDLKRFLWGNITINERLMLCSANSEFMNRRFNELLECIIDENYQHPQVECCVDIGDLLECYLYTVWGFYCSHANLMRMLTDIGMIGRDHKIQDDGYPLLLTYYDEVQNYFERYANHNRLDCEWENSDLYIDIVKHVHANPRWIVKYIQRQVGRVERYVDGITHYKTILDYYNGFKSDYKLPEIHKFVLYKELMADVCEWIIKHKSKALRWDEYIAGYKECKETDEQRNRRIAQEKEMKCVCEVPDDPEFAEILMDKCCEKYIADLDEHHKSGDGGDCGFSSFRTASLTFHCSTLKWFVKKYGERFIRKLVETGVIVNEPFILESTDMLKAVAIATCINKPVLRCLLRWLQSTDLELYEQAKKQVVDSSPLIVKF